MVSGFYFILCRRRRALVINMNKQTQTPVNSFIKIYACTISSFLFFPGYYTSYFLVVSFMPLIEFRKFYVSIAVIKS